MAKQEADKLMATKVTLMKSDFKLIGLSNPRSCTLTTLDNETIFLANLINSYRTDAIWNYCKDHWADEEILAEVEHEGLREDGTPINPIVVNVKHKL